MVTQKKVQGEATVVGNKRESSASSFSKKDFTADTRAMVPNMAKSQNGNGIGFRTDPSISSARLGSDRVLKPWVPESGTDVDQGLESASSSGPHWDQFAENERLFGLKSDYDENIYTTAIDKNHPQYKERMAAADRKAREIERSLPATSHVAEERVMDFAGAEDRGNGNDEEDKYSGVRRTDFPPLTNRENKYTPPAKRLTAAHPNLPADPAIISSQLKGPRKPTIQKPEENRVAASTTVALPPTGLIGSTIAELASVEPPPNQSKSESPKKTVNIEVVNELVSDIKESGPKPIGKPLPSDATEALAKIPEKPVTPMRPSPASARNQSSQSKEAGSSATSTIERDILDKFRSFATQQRINAEKVRSNKAKADKEIKITELKKFADTFKLSTPVPSDLISIIAKDPEKQKEIQAKAMQNAAEMQKAKAEAVTKGKEPAAKESQAKAADPTPAPVTAEPKSLVRPNAPSHGTTPSGTSSRNVAVRQSYGPATPSYHQQQSRNDRNQHGPPPRTNTLSQRLRNHEAQRLSQPPMHPQPVHTLMPQEMRPPTGPAASIDPTFNRRPSGIAPHLAGKLNPNSHEFRPNPYASTFNPNGHPSAGSSPRSTVNQMSDAASSNLIPPAQLIRRKTKAIDIQKCFILSHLKTILPPQGRNWDENDGLRPSYDTLPTWRQLQDDEKPDSTMHLTYREFFERHPFSSTSLATPNPTPSIPHLAHQHQLPFHLQTPHNLAPPRQSPSITAMQMQPSQHMPMAHPSQFGNGDDHRMMQSNSAQGSFASPALSFAPAIQPTQLPYNQPTMQPIVTQYRNFGPQYMTPHPAPVPAPVTTVTSPLMMQHQFIQAQPVGQPIPVYPTVPQFIQQSPAPPQQSHISTVPNGYPSPGRPAALMMAHQGSQQGHPSYQASQQGQSTYGLSPSIAYQQPAYPTHNNMQMSNMRSFTVGGQQNFGTSPQQVHQYPNHRGGSGGYVKNYGHGGQIGLPYGVPPVHQSRGPNGHDDGK